MPETNTQVRWRLSPREREVVVYAAEGFTAEETAKAMYVARSTVKSIRYNAMKKLSAKTMTQAVVMLMRQGEIQ